MATTNHCRTLIAGFGRPGMRDLDFGRQVVRYLEGAQWPEGVVVEDLAYAAPLVLDRLRELEPAKLVLVGSAARGLDAPGTLRRYRLSLEPPLPDAVRRSLEKSLQGFVDIDNTLAVARHWGALPAETVMIEVEPADCSFGLGFSEQFAAVFDPLLAMIVDELNEFEAPTTTDGTGCAVVAAEPSDDLMALVRCAETYRARRRSDER